MLVRVTQYCLAFVSIFALCGACWFQQCAPEDSFENTVKFVNDHCAHGAALGRYIYLGPQQTVHLGSVLRQTTRDGWVPDADLSSIAKDEYASYAVESTAPVTCDFQEQKGWKAAIDVDAIFNIANVSAKLNDNQLSDGAVSFGAVYVDVLNNVATAEDLVTSYASKSPTFKKDLANGVVFATGILRIDGINAKYSFKNALDTNDQATIKNAELSVNPTVQVGFTDDRTLTLRSNGSLRVAAGGDDLRASTTEFKQTIARRSGGNFLKITTIPAPGQRKHGKFYIISVRSEPPKTAHLIRSKKSKHR